MTEQRARVEEWRITTRVGPYVVRYWIEANREHGGIRDYQDAVGEVAEAERRLGQVYDQDNPSHASNAVATALLDLVPAANSVEVCDADGNGCAVHRDWP